MCRAGSSGAALVGWGIYAQNWWGAIGLIPLMTAAVSWCPLWGIFRVSTCKAS
ncbi:MAG: DUF2892 domain-containing protein [Pseudomonadota bacterium]